MGVGASPIVANVMNCGKAPPLRYHGAMAASHGVRVEGERLRFAAAHMATFAGGCEPLHGHNYEVSVELEGELGADSWVWDFGDLKRTVKSILDELDHRFILQRDSPVLSVADRDETWEVRFQDRCYVFPKAEVASLPIDNSTAERLAEWVAGRLAAALRERDERRLRQLRVGVEEMPGQSGWYTVDLQSAG